MDRFMNEEIPKDIPVKLPGPSYSVISRLVLLDGSEEYRPSKAVRWSRSHVMIKLQERDGIEPEYVWLRVEDVQRVLRKPPTTAG